MGGGERGRGEGKDEVEVERKEIVPRLVRLALEGLGTRESSSSKVGTQYSKAKTQRRNQAS